MKESKGAITHKLPLAVI